MYFDIHTHRKDFGDHTLGIINIYPIEADKVCVDQNYSIGIHPLFIRPGTLDSEIKIVNEDAAKDNIVAIGEIGLDKNSRINLDIQKDVFQQQLKTAEKYKKPVIIHCVRCFSEILALKKHSTVPWIIHGFRGKPELASQLIKKDIFLSFGQAVLDPSPTLLSTIIDMPLDKLFLETDDSEVDIKLIYNKIAEIRGIPTKKLIDIIKQNRKKVFGTAN